VDEAHLVDEWGAQFRVSYRTIWTLKVCAPDYTATVAISGSVEEGQQTESIIKAIGFRPGAFHLEKRDCERKNISLIFRDIKYPCRGHQFRDLDWLIP
jgi:superfamily II DNA helicase RecQ